MADKTFRWTCGICQQCGSFTAAFRAKTREVAALAIDEHREISPDCPASKVEWTGGTLLSFVVKDAPVVRLPL